jgi:hypothetical protein
MAEGDTPDLQVGITTTYDQTGAKAAQADIDSIKKTTSTTTKETAAETITANQGIAHSLDGLKIKHEQMRGIVAGLRHTFPEVAHLVHLLVHPISILIAAVAVSLKLVVDRIKEIGEGIKTADIAGFKETIVLARDALDEAKVKASGFETELGNIATKQRTVTQETDAYINTLKEQHIFQVQLEDSQKALALAQLDLLEKQEKAVGTFDPLKSLQQRIALEEKFRQQKISGDEQLIQSELRARQAEKASLDELLPQREAAIRFQERLAGRIEPEAVTRKKMETDKTNIEELTKAYLAAQTKIDEIQTAQESKAPIDRVDVFGIRLSLRVEALEKAKQEMEANKGLLDAATSLLSKEKERAVVRTIERQNQEKEIEVLKQQATEMATRRRALDEEIPKLELRNRLLTEHHKLIGGVVTATGQAQVSAAGVPNEKQFQEFISAAGTLKAQETATGKNAINLLIDQIQEFVGRNKEERQRYLRFLEQLHEITIQDHAEFDRRMSILEGYNVLNRN